MQGQISKIEYNTKRVIPAVCFGRISSLLCMLLTAIGCGTALPVLPENVDKAAMHKFQIGLYSEMDGSSLMKTAVEELGFQEFSHAADTLNSVASGFTVVISGCKSGYYDLRTYDSSVALGNLYARDESCTVSLRSFGYRGLIWTKSGGGDFSGPNSAEFINPIDAESITVTNPHRLPTVLSGDTAVSFRLLMTTRGPDRQLLRTGPRVEVKPQTISYGPHLDWYTGNGRADLELISISKRNPLLMQAKFRIKLQCMGYFTRKSQARSSSCDTDRGRQVLSQYKFRIVKDVFAGNPTHGELVQVFSNDDRQKTPKNSTIITNQDQIWGNSGIATGGAILSLITPESTLDCVSYLIVGVFQPKKDATTWGFITFNLDFATEQSSCLTKSNMADRKLIP